MIDTRCPSDDTLLPVATGETVTEELRGHVEVCAECRSRVNRLRSELDELRSTPPRAPAAAAGRPRPAVIGKYLVIGELDSGGQSVVYRALHPTLDKELVVKLSREPVDSDSDDRDLLVREGKMLASLDHPNLARIYDLDFHGDLPFLVMEYVRGRNLADYVAAVRVTPRHAAGLIAAVARALAVVHRRGIVHQDIKPRNILIDEDDCPRLIDFGLARLRHAWDHPDEPFGGTPAFTSPEQARGEAGQVTARSDLFSLGGVLYYLLTGKAPFDARTPDESLQKASRCEFSRALLDPVRPRRLQAICLRAMAAESDQRYDRAETFADDLDSIAAPMRSRRGLLIGAFGLAAGLFGVWLGPRLFEPPPFNSDLRVEVARGGAHLPLRDALPIDPATDLLRFTARVPAGYSAIMVSYDVGAEVKSLEFTTETADGVLTLRYPNPGTAAALAGRGHTQIVMVLAAPSEKAIESTASRLNQLFVEELGDFRLPQRTAIHFDPHGVRGQEFGGARPDPAANIEERLDRLRRRLRESVPVVLGVAFSY